MSSDLLKISRELCGYCGTCAGVCPENAITLIDLFLEVDRDKCTRCGLCAKVCPLGALLVQREI